MRGFVGLISGGNAMRGCWVQPSRHNECMDNKIYYESFIENVLPTKHLHGRNQCQVQFMSRFLHFN